MQRKDTVLRSVKSSVGSTNKLPAEFVNVAVKRRSELLHLYSTCDKLRSIFSRRTTTVLLYLPFSVVVQVYRRLYSLRILRAGVGSVAFLHSSWGDTEQSFHPEAGTTMVLMLMLMPISDVCMSTMARVAAPPLS